MRVKEADLRRMRSDMFFLHNLDDPNHVESAAKIRSLAQRVLRCFWKRDRATVGRNAHDLPPAGNRRSVRADDRIDKKVECTVTVARAADHQGPFRPLAPKAASRQWRPKRRIFEDAASDRAPSLRSAATSLHCHQVDNCALFGCATSR